MTGLARHPGRPARPDRGSHARHGAEGASRPARYERRLLTKLSAMELPSPPSSGITIQAHR